MTKNERDILEKYKDRRVISIEDECVVRYLSKMKLMDIDPMFSDKVSNVIFRYASTSSEGLFFIKKKESLFDKFRNKFFK